MLHVGFGGKQGRKQAYYMHPGTVKGETRNVVNKERIVGKFGSECLCCWVGNRFYTTGVSKVCPSRLAPSISPGDLLK